MITDNNDPTSRESDNGAQTFALNTVDLSADEPAAEPAAQEVSEALAEDAPAPEPEKQFESVYQPSGHDPNHGKGGCWYLDENGMRQPVQE